MCLYSGRLFCQFQTTFSKHSSRLVFKPPSYLKNNAFRKFIFFINHKGCGAVSLLPEHFEFHIEQYVYVHGHMCIFLCSLYLLFQSDKSRRTLYSEAAYNLLSQWCFASLVSSETVMNFEISVFLCQSFLCYTYPFGHVSCILSTLIVKFMG
jgi:hypothetical protein